MQRYIETRSASRETESAHKKSETSQPRAQGVAAYNKVVFGETETILSKTPSHKDGKMSSTHREFSDRKVVSKFDHQEPVIADYDDGSIRPKMVSKLQQKPIKEGSSIEKRTNTLPPSKDGACSGKAKDKKYKLLLLAERRIQSELNRRQHKR